MKRYCFFLELSFRNAHRFDDYSCRTVGPMLHPPVPSLGLEHRAGSAAMTLSSMTRRTAAGTMEPSDHGSGRNDATMRRLKSSSDSSARAVGSVFPTP
jgi:hypothetical protein